MVKWVGFQGLPGAYSELAIAQYFGKNSGYRAKPLHTFEEVFIALSLGQLKDAILPFENSLAGTIHENYDHLAKFPVSILGETVLRIEHCLMALPGVKKTAIKKVISHPQALAQCADFIRSEKFIPQSFFDTAGAAQTLVQQSWSDTAAIASVQAARLYGLKILARDIADRGENFTRFLHIRPQQKKASPVNPGKGRICSLLLLHSGQGFARIGPLCGILQSLGVELVHCEARPTKGVAWTYYYFLEIAASPQDPVWNLALQTLSSMTGTLKVLGSYRSQR